MLGDFDRHPLSCGRWVRKAYSLPVGWFVVFLSILFCLPVWLFDGHAAAAPIHGFDRRLLRGPVPALCQQRKGCG